MSPLVMVDKPIEQRLALLRSSLGGSAERLEELNERRALGLRERTRCQVHRRLVTSENLGRLLFAGRRQSNDASPSVARVGFARDQVSRLESIHSRGDCSAGELDPTPNLVYRLRSFVEKHLHDREVGEANLGLDAARRQTLEGAMRLHQYPPQVRS